ncbi:MAG: hypothetical protein A3J37_08430 [Alphaproteobacteria bacterium RIFCSPHIGHO2_12_FULL_45_9]|nr:MAG: hypothetical protein A3B66_04000 [Alphaproteobacteria bacterium RIFCSPHIGHO2_02_FULL_46_13]OFW97451.1 MAG: hypothetical protein A3J37_08430 [Alphaproteobacteria bacterium RIFCSPHIGHO2_12_FULL_45_9]
MSDKKIDDQKFENQSSDYDETYEDDVTYTEDDSDQWSDDADLGDDEDSASEQAPPAKKKTSNLTIAIILVVAVVGVFGFMVLKGNSGDVPQPSAENQAAVAIDADAAMTPPVTQADQSNITDLKNQADQDNQGDQTANITPPTPAAVADEPPQGLMDNPNLMDSNAKADVSPADAKPIVGSVPATSGADQTSAVPSEEVVNAISPTVKPVSDFPTVDSIKKPDSAPVPVMTGATGSVDVDPSVEQSNKAAELKAQIDAAQAEISNLEKKISDQAAELEAQKQAVAKATAQASVTASGVSEAEVAALKEQIADLEEKLAAKAEKPSKVVVAEASSTDESEYVVSKPVVKNKPVAAKPKLALKQTWSLKSAGTGKAILSDKATGDLKTVRVGDVVSGLGRIVSISNINSSWVVKGTLGSVSE